MSRLGELLVREKMISLQQLQEAQNEAKRSGRRLGVALSRLGFVNDSDLTQFLARQYSLPSINLNDFEIDPDVLKLVTKDVAMKHMVVPVNRAGATAHRGDGRSVEHLRHRRAEVPHPATTSSRSSRPSRPSRRRSSATTIAAPTSAPCSRSSTSTSTSRRWTTPTSTSSTWRTRPARRRWSSSCNALLIVGDQEEGVATSTSSRTRSTSASASASTACSTRRCSRRSSCKNAITSRLKIMASLDIAERRLPQDGRIKLKIGKDKEMDFRVSVPADAVRREDRAAAPRQVATSSST